MKKVLELPAFRRLLVAFTLNELAAYIATVTLAILVYHQTGSAIGAAAFFLCAEFGPALVSPAFVARLDQRSPRRVLGLLYSLQAPVFLVLAWLVHRFELAPVLVLTLIYGLFSVTARALTRAAWTSVSRSEGLLRDANAIINGSFSVCYFVGPAVGGAIVATGGTRAALLVNVGAYAVIAVTVAMARGLPGAAIEPTPSAGRLRAAFGRAWDDVLLRRLFVLQAVATVFFTISIPVEVVFARHTLHAGPGGYGILLSFWGGGAIIGSGVYARWRAWPSRTLITLGTCSAAAGFLVMAVAPSLAVALIGALIAGFGNGIQVIAVRTAIQEAAPFRWIALILSLSESMLLAVPGVGIVLGGTITDLAGPRVALAIGGAGAFALAAAIWAKLSAAAPDAPNLSPRSVDLPAPDSGLTGVRQYP